MSKLFIKNKYGQTPNNILNDPALSFRAKGLWGYMQSKPDGWSFSIERITQQTREGKSAIREAMKELEEHRLLRREPTKNADGKWNGYDYTLYEKPFADIRLTDNPTTDNYDTLSNKDKVIKNTRSASNNIEQASKPAAVGDKRKRAVKSTQNLNIESEPYKLSSYLLQKIRANDPNFKQPNLQKWAVTIDKLIRLDKREPEIIRSVIDFATKDNFWKSNILSANKLRKQFTTLMLRGNIHNATKKPRTMRESVI